jgi:hypothetical protein
MNNYSLLFHIETYLLTFILASSAPGLSGKMTIHSCLPMMVFDVVKDRLVIPCVAALRNAPNISSSVEVSKSQMGLSCG